MAQKTLIERSVEELGKHSEDFHYDQQLLDEAREYKGSGYHKRHYEEFATMLAGMPEGMKHHEIVHHIASHFAKDNPRFDMDRFKKAVEDRKPKGSAQ